MAAPGLDAQHGAALLAVPFAHRLAGIAVRDAALALDRVQEIDPIGPLGPDEGGGLDQPLLLAGQREMFRRFGMLRAVGRVSG